MALTTPVRRDSAVSRASATARGLALAVVLGLALPLPLPALAHAQGSGTSALAEGGIGLACVLTSLLYSTAKVIYAGVGTITGGAAYVLTGGRKDVMRAIIYPALIGDYVITPEHLRRQRALVFVGPYPEDAATEEPSEAATPPDRYPSEPATNPF